MTKTASPTSAVPGESVVYTLAVTNAGPANVGTASVTDSGLTSADYSSVSWSCVGQGGAVCGSPASGSGNINHAGNVNLPAGGTVTYTINVTIATNAVGTACTAAPTSACVKNTGTATIPVTFIDPTPLDQTSTVEVPISPKADLSIAKSVLTQLGADRRRRAARFPDRGAQLRPEQRHRRHRAGHLLGRLHRRDVDLRREQRQSCPGERLGESDRGERAVNLNGGNPATCAGGGQATFTILGSVVASPSSGVLSNVAKVLAPSGVFDPSDRQQHRQRPGRCSRPRPTSRSSRPTARTDAVPGEPITYSITVFNTGPDDAQLLAGRRHLPGGAAQRLVDLQLRGSGPGHPDLPRGAAPGRGRPTSGRSPA